MTSHHKVLVITVPAITKHPNADTLGLVHIDGYQVVVKLDDFKEGDLAIYIHPDSVVPVEPDYAFLWADSLGADATDVPERYRRITVRRFRKEWSEGLLLKAEEWMIEGQDVAEQMGITHWAPPEPGEVTYGGGKSTRRWRPRTVGGWLRYVLSFFGIRFYEPLGGDSGKPPTNNPPRYDVENFKNHSTTLQPGELVRVTEKIHGSNARYTFRNGNMYAGSRTLWKSEKSKCIWRQVLEANSRIESWCRAHEGYTLYGEVTPTQKDNKGASFHYGSPFPQFFVFDILTPQNTWATNQDELLADSRLDRAPELYRGAFDEATVRSLADGKSTVRGADHIREGVVVRPLTERRAPGLGRVQLKIVSNRFLEVA